MTSSIRTNDSELRQWRTLQDAIADLSKQDSEIKWAMAELALEAQAEFPDEWEALFEPHVSSITTLQNRMNVAKVFPESARCYDVPFWAYKEVYATYYPYAHEMLAWRVDNVCSRTEFRKKLFERAGKPELYETQTHSCTVDSLLETLYVDMELSVDDKLLVTRKGDKITIEIAKRSDDNE